MDISTDIQDNFEVSTSELIKLADFLPYPIIISENRGDENWYLFFNQNFTDKIGYELSDASNSVELVKLLYPEEEYRDEVIKKWRSKESDVQEKGKQYIKIKAKLTCKSGEKKWYEIKGSIVNNLHVTAFVNINSDVLLQEKLKKINSNNDRMLSILGHDLKSPIANLISISSLGEQSEISQQEFITLMQLVKEESIEVLKLLDTTFAWARLNFNTIQHTNTVIDFKALLESVLKVYKSAYESKNINIMVNVDDLIHINSDAEILTVIIRNIISNAIKFTPKDGSISISGTARKLIITDSGIGMTTEMVDSILDNNYLTTRGTNNEKGIGVGLQLVLNLAEKINCRLLIESEVTLGTSVAILF